MHGEGALYRSYLRSNGVQLPTLLINPPPHRSAARSIVSRFHSQPHRRPSVRQRYLRGISPPAYYILHYRPRPSESRSVYTRGKSFRVAWLDIALSALRYDAADLRNVTFFSPCRRHNRRVEESREISGETSESLAFVIDYR